jgi:hypothetical protein
MDQGGWQDKQHRPNNPENYRKVYIISMDRLPGAPIPTPVQRLGTILNADGIFFDIGGENMPTEVAGKGLCHQQSGEVSMPANGTGIDVSVVKGRF